MKSTLDRENENQTLGEVAQFTFTLLGSYWDNSGFDAATQKSYTDESAKTEYSKYSLTDGKSELSKRYIKFYYDIKAEYHAMSEISYYMLLFPVFLLDGITRFDPMFSCDKKHRLLNALMCYIAWAFYDAERKQGKPQESEERRSVIQRLATEKYSAIVSHLPLSIEAAENATWGTINKLLEEVNGLKDDKFSGKQSKDSVLKGIVHHYLFLHFRSAMKKAFGADAPIFDESLEREAEHIDDDVTIINGISAGMKDDTYNTIWYLIASPEDEHRETFYDLQNKVFAPYFVQTYTKVENNAKIERLLNVCFVNDEFPPARYYYLWYKARILIFQLHFDNSDEDKALIKEALALFKEAFDGYKYYGGKTLYEFLTDAIAADVYFSRPEAKTVMANVQDDTGKSSIKKPSKTYWEFAHAVELLDETSKETYLAHYNASVNFWHSFPSPKFANTKAALKRCEKEMLNRELRLPLALEGKKAALPAARRQEAEGRWYTNMSIAIMTGDWDFVKNVLGDKGKGKDEDKDNGGKSKLERVLSANDESGATPLIRALYEYRCAVRYYTAGFRKKRAEVLSRYDGELQKCWRIIADGKYKNCYFTDKEYAVFEGGRVETILDNMVKEYYGIVDGELRRANDEAAEIAIEGTMSAALSMLHPIIMDMIAKTPLDAITDEAHTLDTEFCVSALQLAIDCRDLDFVKAIAEKLQKADKWQNGTLYISEDYLIPLRYAILQYDYLVQFKTMQRDGNIRPLEIRGTPHRKITAGGIIQEDRDFYADKKIERLVRALPEEAAELYIARGTLHSLFEIIKYLANEN